MNTLNDEQEGSHYSDQGFLGRSIVFGLLISGLTFWFADAAGWQAGVVATASLLGFVGISIQQATLIENAILLLICSVLVAALATTNQFGFHWSILVAVSLGAVHGMGGRESRERHQYRTVYGEDAYKQKYGNE